MEEQAQNLLATLKKSSITTDAKLVAFNNLKSNIKHLSVPESAQPTIFECIRVAITSQASTTLVSSGFSTLGHLIKRLSLQEQTNVVASNTKKFLPILLDRLGDARESHRNGASQSLTDFWPYCHAEVETLVRDGALVGHNARAKEMAMLWIVKMNKTEGLQFKTFVPLLVASLEDPDGTVRETAKSCIVELFRNAPEHAKSDLKKRMVQQGVRKTIEAQVVSQLGLRASVDLDLAASVRTMAPTHIERAQTPSTFGDSVMSERPPPQEDVKMDPLYVDTQRELEDVFRDLLVPFEGREAEGNWSARDKNVLKIRRLLKGNAPTEFPLAFVTGVKSVIDGILKVANSLRTTVSTNGCHCVQELATALGSGMDPMVEILIQNFIKTSAATKKIAADNGNKTVEVLLQHVSYSNRLMQHMWLSIQDKNVQTRSFASGWLTILIKCHANQKSHIEHTGGLEIVEKFIKKGLSDANPKVREGTRGTYWAFAQIWPDQAEGIINGLDAKSRGQLEKDSRNPDASNAGSLASSVSSLAASTTSKGRLGLAPGKSSIRDAILAQRKAVAATTAKKVPERPSSAQSSFSPTKASSSSSTTNRPTAAKSSTVRLPSAMSREMPSTNPATSSLMSAPVRRPRRPEIARPATADPYASRRVAAQDSTSSHGPNSSPPKSNVKDTSRTTTRTPGKSHAPSASSTVRSKSRMGEGGSIPRQTPRRSTVTKSPMSSSSKNEDFTLEVPFTRPPDDDQSYSAPTYRTPRSAKHMSVDSGIPDFNEDGFTMVLPTLRGVIAGDKRDSSSSQQNRGTPRLSPTKNDPNSPLQLQRLRSPTVRSPDRPSNPSVRGNTEAEAASVQVYEDPFVGDDDPFRDGPAGSEKPVLEELPLDGRANVREASEDVTVVDELSRSTGSDEQNTPRHVKTTNTGGFLASEEPHGGLMSQASPETLRSRKLLTSGIERIRAKTLDVHGFRRVQDLVKGNQDIWGNEGQRFGDLLLVLLDYLESPNEALQAGGTAAGTKAQNLKTQALATVRAMLTVHRKEAAPYYSRALCSVLAARRQFDEAMHITSDIEKTADEIVKHGQPLDSLNAVLDLIESLNVTPSSPSSTSSAISDASSQHPSTQKNSQLENTSRTIVMSLSVLASLLTAAQTRSVSVSQSQTQRLGHVAVRFLQDADADVRRADLEFCLVLYDRLGGEKGEGFWKAIGDVKEGHMNLITYYLARKSKIAG